MCMMYLRLESSSACFLFTYRAAYSLLIVSLSSILCCCRLTPSLVPVPQEPANEASSLRHHGTGHAPYIT